MFRRDGMTLMEIIVVLIMIAIATVFFFPNFTTPTEHARTANVQNNLLAIYTAEQNYSNNNNGSYCINVAPNPEPACAVSGTAKCAQDLASINCNLSLNIQDDGTYLYSCTTDASGFACTAQRNVAVTTTLKIKVTNAAIQLTGNVNPNCTSTTGNSNWCP